MSNIDKQALIAKIKKQTESFDTVVLKEDEAKALLDELEAAEKRIAELEAREAKTMRSEIDMSDADCFTITRLHEIIYASELKWPEPKLLARFMHDVKQLAGTAKGE